MNILDLLEMDTGVWLSVLLSRDHEVLDLIPVAADSFLL